MIPRSLTGAAFAASLTLVIHLPAPLHAQSLSITNPAYVGAKIFDATPGFTITGLAAAPGGDVYYLETDSAFAASTQLYRRSAGDGYAAATSLFDFGAVVFGSFVRWESGKVFFGENSTGAIRALNADLSIDALGSVAGNYDGAFAGGSLFLSHNPGGFSPENKVSRFELLPDGGGGLMLSAADLIVDTPSDYSGPLAFDAADHLYYGGSGSFGQRHLHRFSAAEVAAAAGVGPALTLDAAHLYLANGGNAYLAKDAAGALWQTNFGTLNLLDTSVPGSSLVGSSADSIGHLDVAGGALFVSVTDGSTFDHSSVYQIVPEPTTAALLLLGLAASTLRRRRQD